MMRWQMRRATGRKRGRRRRSIFVSLPLEEARATQTLPRRR